MKSRRITALVLAIVALSALLARNGWNIPIVRNFELSVYDLYTYALAEQVQPRGDIVILVFDAAVVRDTAKSSPLDRRVLASALRNIDRLRPRTIGVDLIFVQPTEDEAPLIEALAAMRTRTYVAFADPAYDRTSYWDDSVDFDAQAYQRQFWSRIATGNVAPVSPAVGVDGDGVVRRWPVLDSGGRRTLAAAVAGRGAPFDTYRGSIRFSRLAPDAADAGTNPATDMFPSIPISAFADPDSAAALGHLITGRHVLIGADTFDADQLSSPITRLGGGGTISGIFVHAHMLAQAIDGWAAPFLAPWLLWIVALLVAGAGAATGLVERRPWLLVGLIVVQILLLLAAPLLVRGLGFDIMSFPLVGCALGWILSFIATSYVLRSIGADKRRFAQGALGKFLPQSVASEILAHPEKLNLEGERRSLFIIFTDLEGFTRFSHRLEPEVTANILNAYLGKLSKVVLDHEGTIDKYVGDAVIAFWGAPFAREDDAERATRCALALREAARLFQEEVKAKGHALGRTRIGLHHGEAIVGNFGGDSRIQYTALGDAMNIAARLESANKQMGTDILASEAVMSRAPAMAFRPLGRVILSGVATPIAVFEPLDAAKIDYAETLILAYDAFEGGEPGAIEKLRQLAESHPDDIALQKFVERLRATGAGQAYAFDKK